jgi:hypothetical protein
MSNQWEYKFLRGHRDPIIIYDPKFGEEFVRGYDVVLMWSEDDKPLDEALDIFSISKELGLQGWELVAICPRSLPVSTGTTGTTTDELWVFKRPI